MDPLDVCYFLHSTEYVRGSQYKLRMMGIKVVEPAFVFGRKQANVMQHNRNESNVIAYHFVWESVAQQMVDYVCEYWWKRGRSADKAIEWSEASQVCSNEIHHIFPEKEE